MTGNQFQIEFGAATQLVNSTEDSMGQQNSLRARHTQNQAELVSGSLAGRVQNGAFAANQAGQDDWSSAVRPHGDRMVDNTRQAIQVHASGQDESLHAVNQQHYGGGHIQSVIQGS